MRHLHPGDRVAAFANGAFATHVTLTADQVVKLPPGMSCEAGATIPVAFLTAYFSLVVHAQLQADDEDATNDIAVRTAAVQNAQNNPAKPAPDIAASGPASST